MRQIIVRADDAGAARGVNRAICAGLRAGAITAVGFMVPGPAFADAVDVLRDVVANADVGLHATLNAEWDNVRWGPVTGATRVPSLVDQHGHFLRHPRLLAEHLEFAEVVEEISAQLARLRAAGLSPRYLDTHMGFDWLPGVAPALAVFAAREGLYYTSRKPPCLPDADGADRDLVAAWLARIARCPPGVHQLVTHPGADEPDVRAFVHDGLEPGQVARERARETEALCEPRFLAGLSEANAQLVRFSSVLPAAKAVD